MNECTFCHVSFFSVDLPTLDIEPILGGKSFFFILLDGEMVFSDLIINYNKKAAGRKGHIKSVIKR